MSTCESNSEKATMQDRADFYDITIKGHLDERRVRWFDGMTLTALPNGETLLRGPVQDQAALHGLLGRIRDLGLELISVQRYPTPTEHSTDAVEKHNSDSGSETEIEK